MKHFILLSLCFFTVYSARASDDSKWNTLYSYSGDITSLQKIDTTIYGISNDYLFSYDLADSTFETYGKTYNDAVVSICTVDSLGCLAIAYDDSNIQLLYPDGSYVNIPGIKNTQWNVDKAINEISASGTRLYVSTNFGVVIVDAKNAVIKESCVLNEEVYSASENDSIVFLSTAEGILRGNRSGNLQDRNNWSSFSVSSKYTGERSFTDTEITKIVQYKGLTHFLVSGKLICTLQADGTISNVFDWGPTGMLVSDGKLVAYKGNTVYNFTDLNTFTYAYTSLGDIQSIVPVDNNTFFVGCEDKRLSEIRTTSTNGETAEVLKQNVYADGPLTNYPFAMKYANDKLLVVGGGFNTNRYNYTATFSIYDGERWQNSDINQIDSISGGSSRDFSSIAVDPSTENHYFISSWGEGIYEFDSVRCTKIYDSTNSPMENISSIPNYTRVTGLTYDSGNNLWALNTMVDNEVVMMTPDGTWYKYAFSSLKSYNSLTQFLIDSYGTKWIGTSCLQGYLLIWDDNDTYDDTSDDSYQFINSFVDQDGNSLTLGQIKKIEEDMDGNIWLATSIGPFKIYNSSTIVNKSIVLNTIKIPRNDGTDYVDILLENVELTDMLVDGANQKWFATNGSGVYLISADGLSTIYHFTKDNSILPSDNILSLAMDKSTGLIYIGTDKGIVSYQSSYVSGNSDYSNVYTYPNPVRPDYTGDITVKGLQYESTVKITDLNGNIINQGTSSGGTYIWDGKDIRGVRVKTGVYLVFAATESGDQGVVSKIMVVNY